MNSIETKYIEQDKLGQNWLRLNYDSGAAVTELPIAIAGDWRNAVSFESHQEQSFPIWARSK